MPPNHPTHWAAYAVELGSRLQQRRKDAGLTQENLAHAAGLTRTHYQQIELGRWKQDTPANPSIKVLARLAQTLGVEIGELLPDASALTWSD